MQSVVFTRGIPASGKSTWSRGVAASDLNKAWVRVNLDDIREMLSLPWSKEVEKLHQKVQDEAILAALRVGKNVIVDNTHIHKNSPERIITMLWECGIGVDYEIHDFPVDLATARSRNASRSNAVPDEVVARMHNDLKRATEKGLWTIEQITAKLPKVEKYTKPSVPRPQALIVDIDGTLADGTHRGPYDFDRCGEDGVHQIVHSIVNQIGCDVYIILLSGRDSKYRAVTVDWALRNQIEFDFLFMRPEGDTRRDSIIKLELFNSEIRHKFEVIGAIDDRQRVVRMWHQMGIPVLRVGDPDSDF